jgi:lysophospholipase L1-like esterase
MARFASLLVAILAPFAIGGCDHAPEVKANSAPAATILALGDSYTIGEGVSDVERWPSQLAARIRAAGCLVSAPIVVARTGWTIDELQSAIDRAQPKGPFDLVTLMVGVNDQFRGRDAEACRAAFRKLLRNAIALAGEQPDRVIVLSIPDWGATPFATGQDQKAIGRGIDAFNQMEAAEVKAAGSRYIDVTHLSREMANDPRSVAADGLHPSGATHGRWAELALPIALEILRPQKP